MLVWVADGVAGGACAVEGQQKKLRAVAGREAGCGCGGAEREAVCEYEGGVVLRGACGGSVEAVCEYRVWG